MSILSGIVSVGRSLGISTVNLLGLPDKGTGLPTVVQNNNVGLATANLLGGILNTTDILKPIGAYGNSVPTSGTNQPKATNVLLDTTNNGISPLMLLLGVAVLYYISKKK